MSKVRILYGVSGEGSGHSSRAKEITSYLIQSGHEVKIVSYNKGYENLSKYFDAEEIAGLRFAYKNNKIDHFGTLFKNIDQSGELLKSFNRVKKIAKKFKPNLIFSDFEPISCMVANFLGIPLISIDNQHRFTNTKIKVPRGYEMDAAATNAVTRFMIFNSRACLVTSFHPAELKNEKTFLCPPILRKEVLDTKPRQEDYVLVYVTSGFDGLVDVLKKVNDKFVVYGFNKDEVDGNLVFKKASHEGFLHDLAGCRGVIATAGFTLITEALYLGKPYLAIPIKGQFEQVYNAYMLEELGYGKYWDKVDQEKIESFLSELNRYEQELKKYPKEDNRKLFEKIDQLILKYGSVKKWGLKCWRML